MYARFDCGTKLAPISGPSTARQRYAIEMAYRWRAVRGPTMYVYWVEQ